MQVSRLTFTKETQEKMNQPLTNRQKGKLRWERLKELDEAGMLSKARIRTDVSKMLGLGDGYGAGYTWVSNLIKRGHLKETIYGTDANGRMEFEYHIVDNPHYYGTRPTKSKKAQVTRKRKTSSATSSISTSGQIKATIRYGELSIEIEGIDEGTIERIVAK